MNGSSILAKKRAMDPELREDLAELMRKSEKYKDKREDKIGEKGVLAREVKKIKYNLLDHLDEHVFNAAKKIEKRGLDVFIAKKPVDVAEYVRGFVERKKIGIVPSPQTIEAEAMQAFFMSNKAQILSDKYAGQEEGAPMIHPYFPYPRSKKDSKKNKTRIGKEIEHTIISAIVVTENGNAYFEAEEMEVFKQSKNPFVIVTADRIFAELDADKVEHLMEVSSGELIKAEKTDLKGHLIILDNGRLALARNDMGDALMCINCYACSLYCPVYLTVGGLFGSPMMSGIGAISVGYQAGIKASVNRGLYHCTLCKKCEKECPVDVPIVQLIEKMRKKAKISGL